MSRYDGHSKGPAFWVSWWAILIVRFCFWDGLILVAWHFISKYW